MIPIVSSHSCHGRCIQPCRSFLIRQNPHSIPYDGNYTFLWYFCCTSHFNLKYLPSGPSPLCYLFDENLARQALHRRYFVIRQSSSARQWSLALSYNLLSAFGHSNFDPKPLLIIALQFRLFPYPSVRESFYFSLAVIPKLTRINSDGEEINFQINESSKKMSTFHRPLIAHCRSHFPAL